MVLLQIGVITNKKQEKEVVIEKTLEQGKIIERVAP